MRSRTLAAVLMATVALLALTTSAAAGRWASAEVDKPITRVEAGEEMTIEFTLLQHGVTPADWPKTFLEATNSDTGETIRFDATAQDEAGRWSVDVTFPSAGQWEWAIKTEELHVEGNFPTMEVVGDIAPGVTTAQLDAAISNATDPLEKQLSSMSGEIDVLQKQITNLTSERDTLARQIANVESAQANQPEATSSTNWWTAALAGAVAALAVVAVGGIFALRRGLIQSPRLATTSA